MGTVGIVVSLVLLMYLAYRGINVLVLAPVLALLALGFSGEFTTMLPTYTQIFMRELGGYVAKYFPVFMLGAIFGKLMDDSGSARVIAHWIIDKVGRERAILAIVLACAVLTYGGVSLFVVAFAVYPIGAALFREGGIPKRIIPGAIALGSFTFTMTALPGTPSIQNAIPAPFFGTNAFAAPGLGVIASLIMLIGGTWFLVSASSRLMKAGEGYGTHEDEPPLAAQEVGPAAGPSFAVAILPIILVIGLNAVLTYFVFPSLNLDFLAEDKFGKTTPGAVVGLWAIIVALVVSIIALIVLHWSRWKNLMQSVNSGTMGSLLPIFNTASEVGYGSVIASLAAFAIIKEAVLGIAPNNPLISEAIAINVLAGITGSSSGGLSIALKTLGAHYLEVATAAGINPQLLHRVAVMSSGCFDSLPHCGAVITLLSICKLTHRDSYKYIFVVSIVIPLCALAVVVALGTWFGSF